MNEIAKNDPALNLIRNAQIKASMLKDLEEKEKTIPNIAKINEAAQEFEAVFLNEMLKPMFENLKPDPMFGGGKGEEIFQGFMVTEYGKQMAARGGIGIAQYVKAELIKIQEMKQ